MLIARMFWWFPTGRDVKTALLHACLNGQEEVHVRPLLWRWGFTEKGASWRLKKGGQSYRRKLLEFHFNAVPAQPLARQIGAHCRCVPHDIIEKKRQAQVENNNLTHSTLPR